MLSLCTTDFGRTLAGLGGAGFTLAVKPDFAAGFRRALADAVGMIPTDDFSIRMTVDDASPAPSSSATAAFIRGVERRAALFAERQCGAVARGDAGVAAALRAFDRLAPTLPMATWPVRFWSLLLATPDLRGHAPGAAWPAPWESLAALGNGPRAALLLRLVASLEMDDAAAALGVSAEAYRAALQRAIPYRDDGTPDRDTWQAWVAHVRADIESMPIERLARLHGAPQRVADAMPAASPAIASPRVQAPSDAPMRPRARRISRRALGAAGVLLLGVAVIGGIALLRPHWFDRIPGRGDIRSRVLAPADPPASRYDAELAAWSHRDFLLLADVEGQQRADTLPFFAWYAATLAVQPAPDAGQPATGATTVSATALAEPLPVFVPPPRAQPLQPPPGVALPAAIEREIVRVPAAMQQELREQAALWTTWSASQRGDFVRRAAQWSNTPREEQARRREHYQAWRRLDFVAADAVEDAVQAFARLSPDEQARLHSEFDAFEPTVQRGWLLGPVIGVDYPKLQPLLAQLPEAQHAPMLRALRRMTNAERADLAVLAQRVPPQERAELIRDLLSTADDNRAAWLRARLDR